MTLLLRFNG